MEEAKAWEDLYDALRSVLRSVSEEECKRKNSEQAATGVKLSACNAAGCPLLAEKMATIVALHCPTKREKVIEYDGKVPVNVGSASALRAVENIASGGDFIPPHALHLTKRESAEIIRSRRACMQRKK